MEFNIIDFFGNFDFLEIDMSLYVENNKSLQSAIQEDTLMEMQQ